MAWTWNALLRFSVLQTLSVVYLHAFLNQPQHEITKPGFMQLLASKDDKSAASMHEPVAPNNSLLLEQLQEKFNYVGRMPTIPNFRCGFVSIIGAPNMGKSTLLNALLEEDLCIATARPQTTRHAVLGLLTTSSHQVCLIDTPGVIADPAYKLQEGMMEAVVSAVHDADILMVVTDLFSTPIPDDKLFQRIQSTLKPVVVVINKIDLAEKVRNKEDKLSVTAAEAVAIWRQLVPNAQIIVPVTASNGPKDPGVVALRNLLTSSSDDIPRSLRDLGRPIPGMFREGLDYNTESFLPLPLSPPLYNQEDLTDRTERFIASELIRASLFELLKEELPYCCEVRITGFKDKKEVIVIYANIYVERDSQKVIVIGKQGAKIKEIGSLAREKLEEFLQTKVYLKLMVKVDKDWRKNEARLKSFGYLA